MSLYKRNIKRILDIIFSLLMLVILSPVFLILSILIRVYLGTPVIFNQDRPGENEEMFTLYKFRSMTDERDNTGNLLPDSKRLPKFGRILRATSLDELPELWNILKGDMSFIGPRPLAIQYLPYYTNEERLRHSIKPGLTGLAQINGRNTLNWEERFKYDVEYVKSMSFTLDLQIIIKTIKKLFISEDVVTRGTSEIIDFDIYRKNNMKQ